MKPPDLKQVTKRQAIKDQIVEWIREQNLAPGDQILSQNQLAKLFGTTTVTVHRALTELAGEGVLVRHKGKGTFVGQLDDDQTVRNVCLVLPGQDLDRPEQNPYYWPYVQCILRAFMQQAGDRWGFATRAVLPDSDPAKAAASLQPYDVIFFHYSHRPLNFIQHLIKARQKPVVCMRLPEPKLACLTVDHDRVAGARRGVAYLIDLGYRRIGFVGSREYWGDLSFEGYSKALADFGLTEPEGAVLRTGDPRQAGPSAAAQLAERDLACDAVFVDSDIGALSLLDALRQQGIEVPSDLGLMSYDGLDYTTEQPPFLTSVRIPFNRMIAAALKEVEELGFTPTPKRHIGLVGDVVPGRTCIPQQGRAGRGATAR